MRHEHGRGERFLGATRSDNRYENDEDQQEQGTTTRHQGLQGR